ncbi:hypothetical protein OG799_22600 [Micromonospora sp. NBC_00898]|nr:hypothetical protein OG799_22600 [Micromonospora sp. NBC_00898]
MTEDKIEAAVGRLSEYDDSQARRLQLPYVAWACFATALNASLVA